MIPTLRSTLIWVGAVCVLAIVFLGGLAWWYRHPAVDQAQARALQPVIDAYMHQHGDLLDLGGELAPGLKSEVFCDATIIEIRVHGSHLRVGMALECGQYARRGSTLLELPQGPFDAVADVMTSGPGVPQRVVSLQFGNDVVNDPVWVHENFSPLAARWLLGDSPPTAPDPVNQARQAFGFPPGYPAVQYWGQ